MQTHPFGVSSSMPPRRIFSLLSAIGALLAAAPAGASPPPALARAADRLAVADFDEAAAAEEELARENPAAKEAPEALADASLLRLGLGQIDQADADFAALDRAYASKRPDLLARVTLARACNLAGLQAWEHLRDLLRRALPALDRGASKADRAEAHALLARALDRLGDPKNAAAEHRSAIARLARTTSPSAREADILGESRFFLAEQAREKAALLTPPPFTGKKDAAATRAYLEGPAVRWMEQKHYLVELADRAYLRVADIEVPPPAPPRPPPPPSPPGMIGLLNSGGGDPNAPVAPFSSTNDLPKEGGPSSPRWAIAAAAQDGLMWEAFAAEIRSLPIAPRPAAIQEILASGGFVDPVEESVEEQYQLRGKRACEAALQLAHDHAVADEHTRACEAWLGRRFRIEHPRIEEIRPRFPGAVTPPLWAPARR
jgi:hypothetical protein